MSKSSQDRGGIQFESAAQEVCYRRISPLIHARYGESVTLIEHEPVFAIRMGSACTTVYIGALWEDEAIILVSSIVVREAELAPDLFEKLLRENDSMGGLASFSINAKGEITLTASLMGDCSEKQLTLSISEVANTADRYDNIIMQQWGGERAFE